MEIIRYEQAYENFQKDNVSKSQKRQQEIADALEEIQTSDFTCLSAADVNYLASKANITPNEARELNMKHTGVNALDMLNTFIDDETDSIFDFY